MKFQKGTLGPGAAYATPERMREINHIKQERSAVARELAIKTMLPPNPTPEMLQPATHDKNKGPIAQIDRLWLRINDRQWNDIYVNKFFFGRWKDYYWEMVMDLRKQYAPKKGERKQYLILIGRLAAALTTVHCIEAQGACQLKEGKWIEVDSLRQRMQLDGVIRRYIAQLQRYTEAQKHEVTIRDDAVHQTLEKVVGAIELYVSAGEGREGLLEAIIAIATGETIKPPKLVNGQIIEHEPRLLTEGDADAYAEYSYEESE